MKARQDAAAGHTLELERQLAQAEGERREAREKYVSIMRRLEGLQGHEEAARLGVQVACPNLRTRGPVNEQQQFSVIF